ncbi:MAG: carboxypeptidase regulatory-like domain-containing protein [Planctomycetes bacterium]|nr:carboxypeptidase regulatory-like domain-containing protein [Planctomycetota bacterium]
MVRDRAGFFAPFTTDQNGYFRRPNLTAGDWSVTATAKQHTEGRSAVFAAENEQTIDIEDIRLGPGYEVTGYVRDVQGAPIAKAEVRLRAEARDRERRGGPGGPGAGREHRATTDEAGRFSLEHLPGTPMTLDATAAGYLDTRVESVDPTVGQPLQITMPDGLRLTGVAIDTDGSPVATFAVRAIRRRALGAQPPADWQEMSARFRDMPPDEAMRQVRAQFEDRRRGEGGPGQRPGQAVRDLGKPESHPRGEFTITGLQEGVYEVFLQSPEHARFRSSEIDLRLGAAPPHVIAKLDGGVYVAGVVTDTKGAPIRDARVTLRPASLEEPSADGDRRGRARGAEMMMQFAAGMQSLEATTDREGEFVVKHVTRGTYRLQADANGFANASSEVFDLQADRSGFVLQLGPLGSITGVVRGLKEGEFAEARVGAVPIGNGGGPGMFGRGGGPGGMFRNAAVAADGSYTIEDLAPGDYVVRSWIGSPQDLMRELGPSFMDGSLAADVTVKAGDASRFDLAVTRPRVGIVAGSVFHNGTPAAGFHVELARATDDAAPSAPGERGGRGMFANFGRTLQGVIAPSGQFRIANAPEGRYRLRVSTSRRGGAIFEETLDVAADVTVDRNLSVHTSTVQGVMTASDGTDVAQLAGRVSLLPNTSAMPQDGNGRPRNAASFDARLQGGVFHFDSVPPGNHLVVVTIRGRERTSQSVTVGTDGTTKVEMPVGKVTNEVPGAGRPAPTPRQGNVPTNR